MYVRALALHFSAWFQWGRLDSLHHFLRCGLKILNEHLLSSILPQILPEIGGSRDGWSEAMAASALDPHVLVRLDSKSIPRARSFRERG